MVVILLCGGDKTNCTAILQQHGLGNVRSL